MKCYVKEMNFTKWFHVTCTRLPKINKQTISGHNQLGGEDKELSENVARHRSIRTEESDLNTPDR